jgi:predicted ester cyclase
MAQKYSRDELVARLVRAGELEVSGEHPDEVGDYFAPGFKFDGPGGFESDYDGLQDYFASLRAGFDDLSIRRGITIVEGNTIACQTWIEGNFVREFTQSPVGSLPPNGRRVVWDLNNIYTFDDEGRITEELVRADNQSVLEQLQAPASPEQSS